MKAISLSVAAFLFVGLVHAETTDFYGQGLIRSSEKDLPEDNKNVSTTVAPASSVRPQPRKPGVNQTRALSDSELKKYDTRVEGGGCNSYKWATTAPIWPFFTHTFKKCAPGCAPGIVSTYGCRRRLPSGKLSCHQANGGGHAIDISYMVCGQTRHPVGSKAFGAMVNCMETTRYDGGGTRRTSWTSLYEETTGSCAGSSINTPKKKTTCHHDHAHFDLGC